MRILMSALALTVALAWPSIGEADGKKAKARSAPSVQQQQVQRHGKVRAQRAPAEKPCAARTWVGCLGWDPDPNVRMMIQMDAGRDDL
jgi:hypothetical protein